MSRSGGTGSPVWFHCGAWRKENFRYRGAADVHVVELTGRERPYRSRKGNALGLRSTLTSREYRCSCGHVGWSNHIDLARLAGRWDA